MNAPLAAPLLSSIEMAPRDPIYGVTEAFQADPNPHKVDLTIGISPCFVLLSGTQFAGTCLQPAELRPVSDTTRDHV